MVGRVLNLTNDDDYKTFVGLPDLTILIDDNKTPWQIVRSELIEIHHVLPCGQKPVRIENMQGYVVPFTVIWMPE